MPQGSHPHPAGHRGMQVCTDRLKQPGQSQEMPRWHSYYVAKLIPDLRSLVLFPSVSSVLPLWPSRLLPLAVFSAHSQLACTIAPFLGTGTVLLEGTRLIPTGQETPANVCTREGKIGTHDLSRLPSLLGGLACLLRGDRDFPRLLT